MARVIEHFGDQNLAIDFIIKKLAKISVSAIRERGICTIALSGGKTPIPLYKKLGIRKNNIDWSKTHVFLADERMVPQDHPDSNFGVIDSVLLKKINIPRENVHTAILANTYEEEIQKVFKLRPEQFPRFDLILLGIGADGHTASLFPGDPVLNERDHIAAEVHNQSARHGRITLTLRTINEAANVIFFVSGKDKSKMVEQILGANPNIPAALVKPIRGNICFVLDRVF